MKKEFQEILMHSHKEKIIAYMDARPRTIRQAVSLMLGQDEAVAWRAAWVLWSVIKMNDRRMQPFIADMIRLLPQASDSLQREILKILMKMRIPEEMQGILFDTCIHIWVNKPGRIGTRCNALRMMCSIGLRHPDLNREIKSYITPYYLERITPSTKEIIKRLVANSKQASG